MKWTHKKADLFQWKEAQCHMQYYDRCSKAVSMMMGDMVLVCVTSFKGRHKIKSRWEYRENVVEWQPYLNLPVYVVYPIDWGGCSHTLHRNYLLPINNNLKQQESENPVGGDEPMPVPHKNDVLPVKCPTESILEGMPNLPSQQHESFEQGSTGSPSMDPTDGGLQADKDTPVPSR